ncbi:MAG: hypothetical protein GTN78_00320 [Gemmatimonadales bacterium]|nr:hypothetical protein [Gemmatimonadales bacterium]NIQ98637.1 hypothetical protein [Gemmatimonadales bacterium]
MYHLLTILALATVLAIGCGREMPTVPLDAGPAFHLVAGEPLPFTMQGDCSQPDIVDPGTVRIADGVTIIKGRVFDCPTTGDIVGTNRVTWRNAVFGPGPELGHVAGKTTVFVESFFGRTDLEGTFEGPFSGSLADLLFGESILTRTGTGDFRGLVMHGVFFQDPPASGITTATGTIFGR